MGFNSGFKGLMKLECSVHILGKSSSIKFHENPSSENRVVPRSRTDGQAHMKKLKVAFSNFANSSKVALLNAFSWFFSVTLYDRRDIAF
jgi:hypothetical protein